MGPEAVDVQACLRNAIVSEQEPEAKDRLSEDVEDSIGDDLGVDTNGAGSDSDTPDDRVESPNDQGISSDGSEECSRLVRPGHGRSTSINDELVHDDEVGNASPGIVSPLLGLIVGNEGSEEAGDDHNEIGHDGNENAGSVEAGKEAEIKEEEGSGEGPVDVTGPVDLTVDVLVDVWEAFLSLFLEDMDDVEAGPVAGGHGIVRDEGEGGDEGGEDVEESFVSWDTVGHGVEGEGGDTHDNGDDP